MKKRTQRNAITIALIIPIAITYLVFSLMPASAAEWSLTTETDPMTDQVTYIASSSYIEDNTYKTAVFRCRDNWQLDAYFNFGQYLGNDRSDVRYRMDKNEPSEEEWTVSDSGKAVFAKESTRLARQILDASQLIIEARDYRHLAHRATFNVEKANEPIKTILEKCNYAILGLDKVIDGLNEDIALELERWGPKYILAKKKALSHLGHYKGTIDSEMTPEFALATQKFYDSYIESCKKGREKDSHCTSHKQAWNSGSDIRPSVGYLIYQKSPKAIKAESGSLKGRE